MNSPTRWVLTSLFVVTGSLHAQVIWVVPAWQPIAPLSPSAVVVPVPPAPSRPVPTNVERYYFVPSPPGEGPPPKADLSEADPPPANSTNAPMRERNPLQEDGAPFERPAKIIIREYYLPAESIDPTIRDIPIPSLMPRKLAMPPWSDEFENKPIRPETKT